MSEMIKEVEAIFIGNVQDVIFSRANKLIRIPNLFNGFGACGLDDPTTVGEGIVFRGNTNSTPPNSNSGVEINFRVPDGKVYSPFFIGWNGQHSFVLNFDSEKGITLKELYQDIFSKLQTFELSQKYQYVFLEVIGLFHPVDIFDRALQKPVHEGGKHTTAPENSKEFFKSRIIYKDLIRRDEFTDDLFPLCIIGIGHLCEENLINGRNLCENIFYVSPQEMENSAEDKEKGDNENLLTHSHALGWLTSNSEIESILSSIRNYVQSSDNFESIENAVNELSEYKPDYLVHLDDWSILKAAAVKVFLADSDKFVVELSNENNT